MACKDAIQPVARTSVLRLCTFRSMDECARFSLQRMARHCLVFAAFGVMEQSWAQRMSRDVPILAAPIE